MTGVVLSRDDREKEESIHTMPYRPNEQYVQNYTNLREDLLREKNYVCPKVTRFQMFLIGCGVGLLFGSLLTLLVIRLFIFFQELAAI